MSSSETPADKVSAGAVVARVASPKSGSLSGTLLAGAVGSAAAFASWKAISQIGTPFSIPQDLAMLGFGAVPSPEDQARLSSATFQVSLKNAAVWLSASGGIWGMAFAILFALIGRRRSSLFRLLALSVVFAAIFGGLAGSAGILADSVARSRIPPGATNPAEHFTLMVHGLTWLTFGLGTGFGLRAGIGGSLKNSIESSVFMGLVGLIAGSLYPIIAGIFFPDVNSSLPIPGVEPPTARLLWLCLPSSLIGLAAGRSIIQPDRPAVTD